MADFQELNHLSPEVKVLLVNAQTQLDAAQRKRKEPGLGIDLTSRLQIRDDCAELERCIRKITKGRFAEKDIEKLRLAAIRLNTVMNGVFGG